MVRRSRRKFINAKLLLFTPKAGNKDAGRLSWHLQRFTWNRSRKEAGASTQIAHNKQTAHWDPQGSVSSSAEGTKKGIPIPSTGSCLSLGPAPTVTHLSQGLGQGSPQATDYLGPKKFSFGQSEPLGCSPVHILVLSQCLGCDWEGRTGMDGRTSIFGSKVTANVQPELHF